MDKSAIEKIVELGQPNIIQKYGIDYTDKKSPCQVFFGIFYMLDKSEVLCYNQNIKIKRGISYEDPSFT